jgi:(S)-ureidoglycine aminohydrolase
MAKLALKRNCMNELFGFTRNVIKERYALLTPGGFVPGHLPGWENAVCVVLISPGMGARFSQLLVTLDKDGRGAGNSGSNEFFFHVLEGGAALTIDEKKHRLEAGSCCYVPPDKDMQFSATGSGARALVFQKRYEPLAGVKKPDALVSHEREVKGQPLRGNGDVRAQVLLPSQPAFDMAVDIVTCQPGAALASVEAHAMEHGLMMLKGQGIYRLDDGWHPVQAGDMIWMAPYCPHWFVAVGKTPASCICYRDVNRDPL